MLANIQVAMCCMAVTLRKRQTLQCPADFIWIQIFEFNSKALEQFPFGKFSGVV